MVEHFDVVVVGSGFGASAAACRLAQAGRSVLVLERGRSYPPGSFPRSPRALAKNLWDTANGLYGMFDVWAFRGTEALVSSGLGGGSLIYANVLLRKDPGWFVDDMPGQPVRPWPISYADLEPHYEAAEAMLGAQRYPFDVAPYSSTAKTTAMRYAADPARLGMAACPTWPSPSPTPATHRMPSSAISRQAPNLHGRGRLTCRLCGECDIGCNDGAKNTLDYNYLSRAADAGADIRTLSEVHDIQPSPGPGTWPRTSVTIPIANRARPASATAWPPATGPGGRDLRLDLPAVPQPGAFPSLSPALGTRFSGNGDLLTFLHGSRRQVEGTEVPRPVNPELGPVITSAIRMPDSLDGGGDVGRGFYVEDGGNPDFLDWVTESAGAPLVLARVGQFLARRLWAHATGNPRSNISAAISGLLGGGVASATTMPVLCMGRDIPDGTMTLRGGDLQLDWTTASSTSYFDRVESTLAQIAAVLGAALANTPLWLFKKVITVHPLGGVPMGAGADQGVVDGWGEAFGYKGLHVVDGSVMPGPVGPNPSLTITAFAERAAAHIIEGGA